MFADENIFEVVAQDQVGEVVVVVGVAQPGIEVACDQNVVLGERGEQFRKVRGELCSWVRMFDAAGAEEVPLMGEIGGVAR